MRRNRGEYMKNLKKLTILHSNDMHGDFLAERIDERLVGGVSLLSGYVNKVRREEKNVIYAIAGDMFRGSVIDSEYKGTSTIGIMNLMGPDVATIGNHEVDYGLAHLLFLEKCADFPIINANLHIKSNGRRMFRPFWIAHIDGMKILFIGIITEQFGGAFPMWLAPVQVRIMTITDRADDAARELQQKLEKAGIRTELDVRNEKIGFKIREAQMMKIPYMFVLGDKEVQDGVIAVRSRSEGSIGTMTYEQILAKMQEEVETKAL